MKLTSILLAALFSLSAFAAETKSKIVHVRANTQSELDLLIQRTIQEINNGTHRDSCDENRVYKVEMFNPSYNVDANGNTYLNRPGAAIKFRCTKKNNKD